MAHPVRVRMLSTLLIPALAALLAGACGSSSSPSNGAAPLLQQTFTGTHPVTSGSVSVRLTVTPSGSQTLTAPITLRFGGPFQSLGGGGLPRSNFTVALTASGKTSTLGILSTGTAGYVTFQGTSYRLPQSTFQKLESGFAGLAGSPGAGSGSATLSKLGIHPLEWLVKPVVVGDESIAGAPTTHIRAGVNVAALLGDLNTLLGKASTLGLAKPGQAPTSIPPSSRRQIAREVQDPTFDVWTGRSDKTVRRLSIGLILPVSGQLQTQLGGLRSAQIALTMEYADLGRPQTIIAPTRARPISEFDAKLKDLLSTAQASVDSSSSPSAATGTTTSSSPSASATRRYGTCLLKANNDVSKMQRCASLINGRSGP